MAINVKTFSENLTRIRKLKGLSIKDLSEKTGISQRMIIHYEKHATYPPFDKIEVIAKALNVGVYELLGTEENKQANVNMNDFDVRTVKKIKKILILNKQDRAAIYKFIDSLASKEEYKETLKNYVS